MDVRQGGSVPSSNDYTNGGPAKPKAIAQSAPTASFIPPKPPSSRPLKPAFEPPMFDLPPSMPEPGFLESKLAAMTVTEENASDISDEDESFNTGGGMSIKKPSKPIIAKQQPSTMGRSLTNNSFLMAMSLPSNNKNINGGGAPSVNNGSGAASSDLGLGRSPTIFSIMSGVEEKLAAANNNSNNSNNIVTPQISHSSRASITGGRMLPPMTAQPTFEEGDNDFDFEEDEDEDDDDDDALQFNLTK